MNVFFDCDYTLITRDGELRPGVFETFTRLKEEGHSIYVWSGMGIRWFEVRKHNLESFVTDCFHKPLSDYMRRLKGLGVSIMPDIIIDDYLDIVRVFGGIRVTPYVYSDPSDREMESIYQIIHSIGLLHDSYNNSFKSSTSL